MRTRLGGAAMVAVVALAISGGSALAASSGNNSGSAPDQGNCLGNFVNQGETGYVVSNSPPNQVSDLGQFIGKEEHGCR